MRSRVAIAIAKREREKLARAATPAPKKAAAKKSTKTTKKAAVVEAPPPDEAVDELIAEDPSTLEEPGA